MPGKYASRQIFGSLRGQALKWWDNISISKGHTTDGETLRYIVQDYRDYEHIINGIKTGKLTVTEQPKINIRTEH